MEGSRKNLEYVSDVESTGLIDGVDVGSLFNLGIPLVIVMHT